MKKIFIILVSIILLFGLMATISPSIKTPNYPGTSLPTIIYAYPVPCDTCLSDTPTPEPPYPAPPINDSPTPRPPAVFYGTVRVSGQIVMPYTIISARIHDQELAKTRVYYHHGIGTLYNLSISCDGNIDPQFQLCHEGDLITFYIGNQKAQQTAAWHSGESIKLNLTARIYWRERCALYPCP